MAVRWKNRKEPKGGSGKRAGKFGEGEVLLRLFPFTHKVRDRDFTLGRYERGELDDDGQPLVDGSVVEELFITQRTHFIDGKPVACGLIKNRTTGQWMGECQHCNEKDRLTKEAEGFDKNSLEYKDLIQRAKDLSANTKQMANAVRLKKGYKGSETVELGLEAIPVSVMKKFMAELQSDLNEGVEFCGPEGLDLNVVGVKGAGFDYYAGTTVDVRGSKSKKLTNVTGSLVDPMNNMYYVPPVHMGLFDKSEISETVAEPNTHTPPKAKGVKVTHPLGSDWWVDVDGVKTKVSVKTHAKAGMVVLAEDGTTYEECTPEDLNPMETFNA